MSRQSSILESPQTTIGARELLRVGDISRSGFVRRQGWIERRLKFLRWRQKFMVLSRGCLYIFKNEFASSPQKAVFLGTYTKCTRLHVDRVLWAFQIIPEDRRTDKVIVLCCETDGVRLDWMRAVKDEMIKAHKLTESQITDHQKDVDKKDEYVYLEKPMPGSGFSRAPAVGNGYSQHPPPKTSPVHVPVEPPITEEHYSSVDEMAMQSATGTVNRHPTIKSDPPVAKQNKKFGKAGKAKPTVAIKPGKMKMPSPPPSPKAVHKSIRRELFEYPGNDRKMVEYEVLKLNEGGFLVRKSRSDGKEVLSVKIDGMMKEFKIHTQDRQLTLDHTSYFNSVEELLDFYTRNNLPKKQMTLGNSYKDKTPHTPSYENIDL